jgi:hypothetical protein
VLVGRFWKLYINTFTLKMATVVFVETLASFQYLTSLIPESISFTSQKIFGIGLRNPWQKQWECILMDAVQLAPNESRVI